MQTVIEVKRIDLWTLFKLSFFAYAVIGLIGGFFYLFFMMVASGIHRLEHPARLVFSQESHYLNLTTRSWARIAFRDCSATYNDSAAANLGTAP